MSQQQEQDENYEPNQSKAEEDEQMSQSKSIRTAKNTPENTIKFEIRNIPDFKICLESVKFPLSQKGRFNDVLLQVQPTGIVLKSHDRKGNMMTRTMIKKEFFTEGSYQYTQQRQTQN